MRLHHPRIARTLVIALLGGAVPPAPASAVPYPQVVAGKAADALAVGPAVRKLLCWPGAKGGPAGIGRANAAARIEPENEAFDNAIQRYTYREGALFQVYARPGRVTDIVLQEGEKLIGPGPVAAGDTARWMIGDTLSGAGAAQQVHILVKPTRAGIATNLVINTDRRTYHLELRADEKVYMASVSWRYPEDDLIALKLARAPSRAGTGRRSEYLAIENLAFGYKITGDKPAWRPLRVFDDGSRTVIEFRADIARHEMPPLFVLGPDGKGELVNYRVQGRRMIVDGLFEKAELRLGAGRQQQRVRITRRKAAK